MGADFNEGEISPEALQALNELLAEGPGEDASEEEVEAFMAKFAALPGGQEMLASLHKQLAEGGGELLEALMQPEASLEEGVVRELYRRPSSPLRLVFRIEEGAAANSRWRRISLPSDACFFDLHVALQDSFGVLLEGGHRFEWREGSGVEAIFLSGNSEVTTGNDFCEFQNGPLELFSEGVEEVFYLSEGVDQEFRIRMEKLIEPREQGEADLALPTCLDGGGEGGFEAKEISFRAVGQN